jgi:ABC-type transport system involved in cytochrome c biogenesis permease subunit
MSRILISFSIAMFFMLFNFFILKFNGYYNFYSTPVLHDGRVKPLGTLVDYEYKNILKIDGNSNIVSFAKLLFNPREFLQEKIFKINDYSVKLNLGLSDKNIFNTLELLESFRKNFDLINNMLKSDFKTLNDSQKKILNIYSDISLILELSRCLDFIILNKSIDEKFNGLMTNKYDFITKMNIKSENIKNLVVNCDLDFKLFFTENDIWLDLNGFFLNKKFEKNDEMDILSEIGKFFIKNDIEAWNKECLKFKNLSVNKLSDLNIFLVNAETFYNNFKLIFNSCVFFLFSFLLILLFNKKSFIFNLSKTFFFLGFLMLFSDLFFRIILTQKSPVTSLHESLIFVNFIFVLFFLVYFFKSEERKFFLISAFVSFLLSLISINLSEENNINSVVAVLNTNFWLIVHVLTISVGYGLCLISGFLSHLYLYQILNKKYFNVKNNLYGYIFNIALLALFFSFIGTLLGGIWADQSWGRFWGWDPKENGALLIVLWLTLIFHAKSSNLISEINFIIGVVLNLIVLSLAWFGVNLLSVGLHSYGFIKNIGVWLVIYIAFEMLLVIYFIIFYKKKYLRFKDF